MQLVVKRRQTKNNKLRIMSLRLSYMSYTPIINTRPPPPSAVILFSLSDKTNPDDRDTKPPQRQKKTSRIPRQPQQVARKPSVAEIERAIGAGIYKDRDINRESEQEKTLFDTILSNSIGRTEGDVEKKLRETGEWILNNTEGPSRSTGKNILKVVFLWILPLWMLSFLVAFGVIRIPFVSPFLDDFIM